MDTIIGVQAITGILLWGFVATVVMTIIMFGSQMGGLSRLSLPFLLGTCLTSNRDYAQLLGITLYLAGGWVFALFYTALFAALAATWWIGALAGLIHALFILVVVLPVLPHFHPGMATEYDGPTELKRLEPPGFMGFNYGYMTPLTTVAAHMSYSMVLGAFLPQAALDAFASYF